MILGHYFIQDCGDGSCSARFFKDKEQCDLAVAAEEQEYGYVMQGTTELTTEDFK